MSIFAALAMSLAIALESMLASCLKASALAVKTAKKTSVSIWLIATRTLLSLVSYLAILPFRYGLYPHRGIFAIGVAIVFCVNVIYEAVRLSPYDNVSHSSLAVYSVATAGYTVAMGMLALVAGLELWILVLAVLASATVGTVVGALIKKTACKYAIATIAVIMSVAMVVLVFLDK